MDFYRKRHLARLLHCLVWISLFSGAPIVASHLSIITANAGNHTARALNGQKSASDNGDAFAAMLNGQPAQAAAPASNTKPVDDKAETEIERLARLALEATANGSGDDKENAEAIAAALDLQPTPTKPVDPAPVIDLVEALSALKTSLDAGKPVDPDLLARIDTALNNLAEALGLNLSSLETPDDFTALLDNAGKNGNGLADALAQMLAPLTGQDTADAANQTGTQDQLKAVSDKLAALLAALENGAANEEQLTAIGMKPGEAPADEIEAALSRFVAMLKTNADVPEEPVLATPTLKTSEPVLVGKTSETHEPRPAQTTTDKPVETKSDSNDRAAPRDNPVQQRETRPTPAQNVTVAETNTPQASAPPTQDTGALRVDAATPRVVIQAGYQTSQQQLNLPQIAFEMARQVQDGNSRFQIRLDPPELGRIDVRLDIDKSGQVHARLTVEKSETLDLMQRDQRALERALQQAGLDSNKTNLEFSLKQNPFAGQERNERDTSLVFAGDEKGQTETEETALPTVNLYRGSLQASGVNIIA